MEREILVIPDTRLTQLAVIVRGSIPTSDVEITEGEAEMFHAVLAGLSWQIAQLGGSDVIDHQLVVSLCGTY